MTSDSYTSPKTVPGSAKVIYRIDDEDRLVFVNDDWDRFARENDGVGVFAADVLGTLLWQHISGADARQIYQMLVGRVRGRATATELKYRCDSPDKRRLLQMRILLMPDNQVEFQNETLRIEDRQPLPLLDRNAKRSGEMLRICSWCRKVQTPVGWLEVEEAVQVLGLLELETAPQLTHVMCENCNALGSASSPASDS